MATMQLHRPLRTRSRFHRRSVVQTRWRVLKDGKLSAWFAHRVSVTAAVQKFQFEESIKRGFLVLSHLPPPILITSILGAIVAAELRIRLQRFAIARGHARSGLSSHELSRPGITHARLLGAPLPVPGESRRPGDLRRCARPE